MVIEHVKTTVNDVYAPPCNAELIKTIEGIIPKWKVTEHAPDRVKIEFEGNTPENQKVIKLSSERARIECVSQHKGNMQNLRELTDAFLKLAAHSQEDVRETLKKSPVTTQLIYEGYPCRLRDEYAAGAFGVFISSDMPSMIFEITKEVEEHGQNPGDAENRRLKFMYGFFRKAKKVDLAFSSPLERIEPNYQIAAGELTFEEPKRDVRYII